MIGLDHNEELVQVLVPVCLKISVSSLAKDLVDGVEAENTLKGDGSLSSPARRDLDLDLLLRSPVVVALELDDAVVLVNLKGTNQERWSDQALRYQCGSGIAKAPKRCSTPST